MCFLKSFLAVILVYDFTYGPVCPVYVVTRMKKTQQTKNKKLSSPNLSRFTENAGIEEEEEKEEVEIKEEEREDITMANILLLNR